MNSIILDEAHKSLARNGKTFYWARCLLSKHHANRATRLYFFCRYLDDIADESADLEKSKAALLEIYKDIANNHSSDPIVNDAISLFAECNIDKDVIFELIKGLNSDLGLVRFVDNEQLLKYCYRVAGTVGLMMCKVLDIKSEQAYQFAIDLGIAMQLTNISRDILEDAKLNRRYVPESMHGNFNPTDMNLDSAQLDMQMHTAIQQLTALASQYYKSGNSGLPYISFRARVAILLASKLYQAISVKLIKAGKLGWRNRVVISKPHKLKLSIFALLTHVCAPNFWVNNKAHNPKLHAALQRLPHTHEQAI